MHNTKSLINTAPASSSLHFGLRPGTRSLHSLFWHPSGWSAAELFRAVSHLRSPGALVRSTGASRLEHQKRMRKTDVDGEKVRMVDAGHAVYAFEPGEVRKSILKSIGSIFVRNIEHRFHESLYPFLAGPMEWTVDDCRCVDRRVTPSDEDYRHSAPFRTRKSAPLQELKATPPGFMFDLRF